MTAALKSIIKAIPGMTRLIAVRDHFAENHKVRDQFSEFRHKALGTDDRFKLDWEQRWVCLGDDRPTTSFDRHYLYHMAWAARKIAEQKPEQHHDFSSHLHFASMVSAFVPTTLYEFRPPNLQLDQLGCATADLTQLPMADESLHSISTMHVVEHLGLGRYGDPIRPDADLAAMAQLKRVLAPGGSLYFVTPVGKPRLAFNSCRVYGYDQVRHAFDGLDLDEFALIEDDHVGGPLIRNADPQRCKDQAYACGCFHFVKPHQASNAAAA